MKFLLLLTLIPLIYGEGEDGDKVCFPEKSSFAIVNVLNDEIFTAYMDFSQNRYRREGVTGSVIVDMENNMVYDIPVTGPADCYSFPAFGPYVWSRCLPAQSEEIATLQYGIQNKYNLEAYKFSDTATILAHTEGDEKYPVLRRDIVGGQTFVFMAFNITVGERTDVDFTIPDPCPPKI